jgi:hypothetical protein
MKIGLSGSTCEHKTPTVSEIQFKETVYVQLVRIRPTNYPGGDVLGVRYLPILLLEADDGFFYIADGNHRFFKKLVRGDTEVEAWILEEGDQEDVVGNPLPQYVREWKEGKMSLEKLTQMAKNAYRNVQFDVESVIQDWYSETDDGRTLFDSSRTVRGCGDRVHDVLISGLFSSILKIMRGTSSIKEEAEMNRMGRVQFSKIYSCFLQGGMEALEMKVGRIMGLKSSQLS